MKKDPIVEKVRKQREAHAKKFGYDLKKIYRDFKESEIKRNAGKYRIAEPSADYSSRKK